MKIRKLSKVRLFEKKIYMLRQQVLGRRANTNGRGEILIHKMILKMTNECCVLSSVQASLLEF